MVFLTSILRSRSRGGEVILVAFDLIEHDGDDLRERPLVSRKRRLAKLIGKTTTWRAIQYGDPGDLRSRLPVWAGGHCVEAR